MASGIQIEVDGKVIAEYARLPNALRAQLRHDLPDITREIKAAVAAKLTPGASNGPGASYFYPLIEAVENAMDPEPNLAGFDSVAGSMTLNGIITVAWLEGSAEIVPGDIDPVGLGMATVPLRIVIP